MVRLLSLFAIVGALWLAHTALPQSNQHLRLSTVSSITANGDTQSLKRTAYAQTGRSASDVFGATGTFETTTSLNTLPVTETSVPFADIQPKAVKPTAQLAALPLPSRPSIKRTLRLAHVEPAAKAADTEEPQALLEVGTRSVAALPARKPAGRPITVAALNDITELVSKPVLPQASLQTVLAPSVVTSAPEPARMSRTERRRVARNIQRELRRVGCYSGATDGVWGRKTRTAMQRFAATVSGNVPTSRPDYVALMLIENHHARACKRDKTILAKAKPSTTTSSPAVKLVTSVKQVAHVVETVRTAEENDKSRVKSARKDKTWTNWQTTTTASVDQSGGRAAKSRKKKFRVVTRSALGASDVKPSSKKTNSRIRRASPRVIAKRRVASVRRTSVAPALREKAAQAAQSRRRTAALRRAQASKRAKAKVRARKRIARKRAQRARRARLVERERRIAASKQRRRNARRYRKKSYGFSGKKRRRNWVRRAFSNTR